MTTERVALYSERQVCAILAAEFGESRRWGDLLADFRRCKRAIKGKRLMPFCRVYSRGAYRPHYTVGAVREFVTLFRTTYPALNPTNLEPLVMHQPPTDVRGWWYRTVTLAS